MIKVLSVFGTRPEAIKMAPVIKELDRFPERITSRVCVTAQHREMLDQVLGLFGIQPDYDLNLMQPKQTLASLTARVLTDLEPVIIREKPDWMLVQGDTTTVMAASIVAFYHHVKIGHVEAGLRTGNKLSPFPEEVNRKIAGTIADLHFAPTEGARSNLLREGISPNSIHVTGNPVIDALHLVSEMTYDRTSGPLSAIPFDKRVILVTSHRRENFGRPLEHICSAISEIARQYRNDVHFVYAVHLNPNVQEPVYRLLGNIPNVSLVPPLEYLPLVHLMKRCHIVLTDSGGIQEEAPGLGKPVLVLRETTERPEAVDSGTVRLVGTDSLQITTWIRRLLDDPSEYARMAQATNPYGDGLASQRIVRLLLE